MAHNSQGKAIIVGEVETCSGFFTDTCVAGTAYSSPFQYSQLSYIQYAHKQLGLVLDRSSLKKGPFDLQCSSLNCTQKTVWVYFRLTSVGKGPKEGAFSVYVSPPYTNSDPVILKLRGI